MKKFFIIFAVVGVAFLLPSKAEAQTKAFKEKYKQITHNIETQPNHQFKEIAMDYAEQLFNDIKVNLPIKVKKNAPIHFERYGRDMFYSLFPRNHHTTWYVFYSVHEVDDQTINLVRYLGNNHTLGHKLSD